MGPQGQDLPRVALPFTCPARRLPRTAGVVAGAVGEDQCDCFHLSSLLRAASCGVAGLPQVALPQPSLAAHRTRHGVADAAGSDGRDRRHAASLASAACISWLQGATAFAHSCSLRFSPRVCCTPPSFLLLSIRFLDQLAPSFPTRRQLLFFFPVSAPVATSPPPPSPPLQRSTLAPLSTTTSAGADTCARPPCSAPPSRSRSEGGTSWPARISDPGRRLRPVSPSSALSLGDRPRGGRSGAAGAVEMRMAYPSGPILSSTRELSMQQQIHEVPKKFSCQMRIKVIVAYGGAPITQQVAMKLG